MDWMVGSELEICFFFVHIKYRKTEWQSTLKDCNAYMGYVNSNIQMVKHSTSLFLPSYNWFVATPLVLIIINQLFGQTNKPTKN